MPAFLNESHFSPSGSNIIEGLKACHFHNLLESCSDNSTLKALALSWLHAVSIGRGESCYFFFTSKYSVSEVAFSQSQGM